MSETSDVPVVDGDAALLAGEAVVLKEGDADWRPWSGGHESPLEALWQWMVSKGVGVLKAEAATEKTPTGSAVATEQHD